MTLATVDDEGRPHCRVLLLKGLDAQGFTFFTNYTSAKGQQLAARPYAAMTFFWPTLERQVRIEGQVVKVTPEESEAYYQVRPLGSRIGAWASPQSQVIADRDALAQLLRVTQERFSDTQPHCPEHWGGFRLLPERIEFWRGDLAACMIVSTIGVTGLTGRGSGWRLDAVVSRRSLQPLRQVAAFDVLLARCCQALQHKVLLGGIVSR